MLKRFDDIQLAVLRTHIAIHRECIRRIAIAQAKPIHSIPRKKFMKAAYEALPGKTYADLRNVLQLLDAARNELAHSEDTTAYAAKLSAFVSAALPGPTPDNWDERDAKTMEALAFAWSWLCNAGAPS